MKKLCKHKYKLILLAILIVAIVAFIEPEYTEQVARSLALFVGLL